MAKRIDLTGQKFGKLEIIEYVGTKQHPNGRKSSLYRCRCDCGNEIITQSDNMKSGNTISCGCIRKGKPYKGNRRTDLTNKRFGKLTVIRFYDVQKRNARWWCKCDCGKELPILAICLKSGSSKSCGCLNKDKSIKEFIGKRFGKLRVVSLNGINKWGNYTWDCICDCGGKTIVAGGKLKREEITSCGCNVRSMYGLSKERLYQTWKNMLHRCYDENAKGYKYYGARGITVCEEWKTDFMSFYTWAINNGYEDNLTIDKIDNDKGYYPDNCQWITKSDNIKKSFIDRKTRRIDNGKEKSTD